MSLNKRIKIVSSLTELPQYVDTNATTFGELKADIAKHQSFHGINWRQFSMFMRDRHGRHTLGLDDETITSEAEATLYMTPSDHKGGTTVYADSVLRDIRDRVVTLINGLIENSNTSSKPSSHGASNLDARYTVEEIQDYSFDDLVDIIEDEDLNINAWRFDAKSKDNSDLKLAVIGALEEKNLLFGKVTKLVKHPLTPESCVNTANYTSQELKDMQELGLR